MRLERERYLQRQSFKEHEMGAGHEENKVDLVDIQVEEDDETEGFLDGLPRDAALRRALDGAYAGNNRADDERPCPFILLLFKKITLFC